MSSVWIAVCRQHWKCHTIQCLLTTCFCSLYGNPSYSISAYMFYLILFVLSYVLQLSFNDTEIVPCNVRLGFNEITADTVQFKADEGGPYTFQVHKISTKTKMGGEDWRRFTTENYLSNGDLICF